MARKLFVINFITFHWFDFIGNLSTTITYPIFKSICLWYFLRFIALFEYYDVHNKKSGNSNYLTEKQGRFSCLCDKFWFNSSGTLSGSAEDSIGQNLWVRGNATKKSGSVNRARTGVEKMVEMMMVATIMGLVTTFIWNESC